MNPIKIDSAELLDKELLAKIRTIQIRAKSMVSDVFAGEYLSAFKGRGIEFEEVREYQPGDDVRSIDWNVTARTGKPFIKRYRDERELTVMFVVDVSGSSRFGTVTKFKNEVATEIAALLAYTALRNNDKVGLIIFSDHVEHYIPPKKGRGHVWQIIRDVLTHQSNSKNTDLNVPLEFLSQVQKKKAITFLISDFQGGGFETKVRTAARRHDLIAISITDPRELELPAIGYIELEDAETGEYMLVDTGNLGLRKEYNQLAKRRLRESKRFFHKSGIDYIEIHAEGSYLDPIIRFFKNRERRR